MNKIPPPEKMKLQISSNLRQNIKRQILNYWWWLLLLLALVGIGTYLYLKSSSEGVRQGNPQGQDARAGRRSGGRGVVPVVVVAPAKTGDINVYLNGLGAVTPLATVTVKTHLAGELMKVLYTEGQMVKKGQLLAIVDPRPYQMALEQAEANLAHDNALLDNARVDLLRYQTLFKQDSIQEQQVTTQDALVHQYAAQIKSDQAAVDTQKLNVAYCNITAPVEGRVGLRLVDPGNIVQPGDATGLFVITQLQPISVVFAIPEDNIPAIMQNLQAGIKMSVDVFDRSYNQQLASGKLLTLDNEVNVSTGTVNLKARFSNDNFGLFPNQFVNARLLLETKHGATIIPSSGVQRGNQGTYVYVIQDGVASLRLVKVGITEGDNSSILEGLNPKELVVVDGADKLRDGLKVEVADKDGNKIQTDAGDDKRRSRGHGRDNNVGTPSNDLDPAGSAASAAQTNEERPHFDPNEKRPEGHRHHRADGDAGKGPPRGRE